MSRASEDDGTFDLGCDVTASHIEEPCSAHACSSPIRIFPNDLDCAFDLLGWAQEFHFDVFSSVHVSTFGHLPISEVDPTTRSAIHASRSASRYLTDLPVLTKQGPAPLTLNRSRVRSLRRKTLAVSPGRRRI